MDFKAGGVWLINKPAGWTSFDVVNKLRYTVTKKIGERIKVGHAGTLDPFATGLLLVCYGKMTKRIDEFTGMDKEYTGTIMFGATTPTYDPDSEIDQTYPTTHLNAEIIARAATKFVGAIQQVPPAYSAIKVEGNRSYDLARKGTAVELKARPVNVHQLEFTRIEIPEVDFRVLCSKGTYIRSLAYDLGKTVESGAYLKSLCRTKIGDFSIGNSLSIEQSVEQIKNAEV